jgi:pimeloyl-ACP methyl ester carboxylesterase
MRKLNGQAFDWMRGTPLYTGYAAVAPDPAAYPTLMDKTGALLSTPYDWTDEVRKITTPTFLVYADADSVATRHGAEFFGLLGGGRADGHPDGTIKTPMRLAILPGRTHYNVADTPGLAELVAAFLDRT